MSVRPGAPPHPDQVPPPPSPHLAGCCLVLVRTQGPVNLGMIARLCGNFGIHDLRLVAPQCTVDCPEARKYATHNREQLLAAPVFPDLASAVADCGLVIGSSARTHERELGPFLTPAEVPAAVAARAAARWALVFGNEADGLRLDELRRCHTWVHLAAFGANVSYNLAVSVALTLYGIATVGHVPPRGEREPVAPQAAVDALYEYWLATLERFRYFRRADPAQFRPLLRRMLQRWGLTMTDVQALRGMLAQMNYVAFGRRFDRHDRAVTEPEEVEPAGQPETEAPRLATGASSPQAPPAAE